MAHALLMVSSIDGQNLVRKVKIESLNAYLLYKIADNSNEWEQVNMMPPTEKELKCEEVLTVL